MAKAVEPAVKAAALAALATGTPIRRVAEHHGLGVATVHRWQQEAFGSIEPVIGTEKRRDLGALLVDFLEDSLVTLREHVRLARNPDWFTKQDANQIAIFDGVLVDKTTRLLSAYQAAFMEGATDGPAGGDTATEG